MTVRKKSAPRLRLTASRFGPGFRRDLSPRLWGQVMRGPTQHDCVHRWWIIAPDDAEHGFFRCDAWENWRRQTCVGMEVDEIVPDNLVDIMLSSPTRWTRTTRLISKIMSTREKEERERQRPLSRWRPTSTWHRDRRAYPAESRIGVSTRVWDRRARQAGSWRWA